MRVLTLSVGACGARATRRRVRKLMLLTAG